MHSGQGIHSSLPKQLAFRDYLAVDVFGVVLQCLSLTEDQTRGKHLVFPPTYLVSAKLMLWILKRIESLRRCFYVPTIQGLSVKYIFKT